MIIINNKSYRELRCGKCRKLFGYEKINAGRIAIVCPRCGELNQIEYKYLKNPEVITTMNKEFSIQLGGENEKGGEK